MEKIILVDALHINDGGGKILLDYLIESIEKLNLKVVYLLDERITNNHFKVKENKVVYLKSSLRNRYTYYVKNKGIYYKIFCFGNIPPPINMKAYVITYFHQNYYLEIPPDIGFFVNVVLKLKIFILKLYSKNSNLWLTQSDRIKEALVKRFRIKTTIDVVPFYPEVKSIVCKKNKHDYLYVSNGTPHKNHERLILAFCKFFDKHKKGKLILTVSIDYSETHLLITKMISKGYPIQNHGFINHRKLAEIYGSSKFIIFPSLTESLGLGIVEAIDNKCIVIGADLPYTYAVCNPSIVFNPWKVDSIADSFVKSLEGNFTKSEKVIVNEIHKLIKYLQ